MNFSISLLQLLGLSLAPQLVTPQGLNVTAITAINGASVLECWSLTSPPTIARGAANYDIGSFKDAFVGVIAPRTYIGKAWAPAVEYAYFPIKALQTPFKKKIQYLAADFFL
jgi:hypothetical protein